MTIVTPLPTGDPSGVFAVGVDTHTDTHTLAILNPQGQVLHTETFPATPCGYRKIAHVIADTSDQVHVGIEGTNSYGAGLTRALCAGRVHRQ